MSFSGMQFGLSKPPISSLGFQVGDSNFLDTAEDPALVEAREEWLKRAEKLPSQNRDPFKQYIHSIWKGVSRTISQTSQLKHVASNNLDNSTSLLQKLNSEAERRFNQDKTNTEKQEEVEQSLQNSINKLEKLQISSKSFKGKEPKKAPEKPNWRTRVLDIHKQVEQGEVLDRMADAHVAVKALDVASKLVTVPIGMLGKTASNIYNKSTMVQKICSEGEKKAKALLKPVVKQSIDLLHQAGIPEFCVRQYDQHVKAKQRCAEDLSQLYSIPLPLTTKYVSDAENVVIADCIGQAGKIFSIPIKYFKSVLASRKTAKTVTTLSNETAVVKSLEKPALPTTAIPYQIKDTGPQRFESCRLPYPERSRNKMLRCIDKVTDVTHLAQEREELWKKLAQKKYPSSQSMEVEYLKDTFDITTVKLSNKKASLIVKEKTNGYEYQIMDEYHNIKFLQSLDLEHLHVPKVVSLAKYGNEEAKRYIMIKEFAPGDTFEEMATNIGKMGLATLERREAMNIYLKAAKEAGKGLGEFHSIKVLGPHGPHATRFDVEKRVAWLFDEIKMANEVLSYQIDIGKARGLTSVIKEFERDPSRLRLSFGLGDIHSGNCAYSKKGNVFSYFDADGMNSAMTTFPLQEYRMMRTMFTSEGTGLGLSPRETYELEKAFARGYSSQSSLYPPSTDNFFQTHYEIDIIRRLAEDSYYDGIKINPQFLKNLVYKLNSKLQ